jgi:hypothetical protein
MGQESRAEAKVTGMTIAQRMEGAWTQGGEAGIERKREHSFRQSD